MGHGWQGFGSGHLTTGQRGRGQGGHSPILQGLLQDATHGGHLGTDDFNTYLDISGYGGHSVFNIYLDRSGKGGHGGTVAFKTYLDISGIGGHVGHEAIETGPPGREPLELSSLPFPQSHGLLFLHL